MLPAVLALIGFTAVIAQIVLMRELIVVFYGNEMALGIMLASWLLWTAVGSSLLGRLAIRVREPRKLMAGLQALLAVAFPLSILAVRASRSIFQPIPGEILGPGPAFVTSFVALSFFCVVSGWLFAAGSRLYARQLGRSMVAATGSVYLLEAAGSGIGGVLASLVLIQYLHPFEIAGLLALLNLLAAAGLSLGPSWRRGAAVALLLGVFLLVVFPLVSPRLETLSLSRLWRGFRLVTTRNSVYGNLVIVETRGNRSLFENGLVVFTAPDPAAAEEAVHFALLQHPSPRNLLMVGGGINGSLAQALQHASLERVDYVELDPAFLDLARKYFPTEWGSIQADPRVHVHKADGRLFLKTVQGMFDVIIVNLPEPQTAQLNRFYTLEFFREAVEKLAPSGVFSFQLRAAENYISPELADFLRCINKTLRRAFPVVTAIPGDTVHFFAAKRAGVLADDAQELLARLRARQLHTQYVREYYVPFRMMPDRMLDLEQQIRPQVATPVNRDFAPIAYYFGVVLWSTRFNRAYRDWFQRVAGANFDAMTAGVLLALFALFATAWWLRGKQRRPQAAATYCVAAMGFTLLGLEVLLLLGFQAIYGYVYHQLAIVIAAFMVGMALGSWWGLQRVARSGAKPIRRQELQTLAGLQILAALSPVLLYALFVFLAGVKSLPELFLASEIVFPALALLCGLMGGYQFPVASRIFFADSAGEKTSPGTLYGLDLVGACVGAIALSAYLVPVFGFLRTALLMAVVNLVPAALAGLSASEMPALRE